MNAVVQMTGPHKGGRDIQRQSIPGMEGGCHLHRRAQAPLKGLSLPLLSPRRVSFLQHGS